MEKREKELKFKLIDKLAAGRVTHNTQYIINIILYRCCTHKHIPIPLYLPAAAVQYTISYIMYITAE